MSLEARVAGLPEGPGVYQFRDGRGHLLYIGKARSLRARVRSYFQDSSARHARTEALVRQVRDVAVIVTDTELEAVMLEATLVRRHRPRFNIVLRDDKHYPFLKLTTHEAYPRLVVVRRVADDGATYLGPFHPATAMRETLRLVREVFPLRTCAIRIDGTLERPCLQYHIHRCNAPCTGWESREGYAATVRQVARFLAGHDRDVVEQLHQEMEAAVEALNFERAARVRDRLAALERVRERQKVVSTDPIDRDVLGLARQGRSACVQVFFVRGGRVTGQEALFVETGAEDDAEVLGAVIRQLYGRALTPPGEVLVAALPQDSDLLAAWLGTLAGAAVTLEAPQRGVRRDLVALAETNAALALRTRLLARSSQPKAATEELQRVLALPEPPARIEAFDVSTLHGAAQVGALAVWEGGDLRPAEYRRFKVKGVPGADDFASMAEIVERRYARLLEEGGTLPDLILIDGGRGQVGAAAAALAGLGLDYLPLVGLAKERETLVRMDGAPGLELPEDAPALLLLRRLRDEAHRFAVTFHRKVRGRAALRSPLDAIPGVGPTTRTRLLRAFGSARGVRGASLEALYAVPGLTRRQAEAVRQHCQASTSPPA